MDGVAFRPAIVESGVPEVGSVFECCFQDRDGFCVCLLDVWSDQTAHAIAKVDSLAGDLEVGHFGRLGSGVLVVRSCYMAAVLEHMSSTDAVFIPGHHDTTWRGFGRDGRVLNP